MKKLLAIILMLSLIAATSVDAQTAPPPRAMPRVPVSRQVTQQEAPVPASREVQGPAAIIDGEKLRIGDTDLRLFGVVPPQLAASFGPQARAELDNLAGGQTVACQIRDRDRDGRLLATCHNAAGLDMALELLRHGLAVSARGTIASTELAAPYATAEQTAQTQHLGLWSVAISAPAPVTVAAPIVAPKQEAAAPTIAAEPESKKEDKTAPRTDKTQSAETATQTKITDDILAQRTQARIDDTQWTANNDMGFFERYQLLIACVLMVITATAIMIALWAQKSRDRRDETMAVAAALRGELMAARSVCLGRARALTTEAEDRAATWPRIRATLYQAYVGRLGLLGAELARQVSSIYGQSSDYAALYNSPGLSQDVPKKTVLETLARRIEEVLPKLEEIEAYGYLRGLIARPMQRATSAPPSQVDVPPETETPPEEPVEENPVAAAPVGIPATKAMADLWETVRGFAHNRSAAPMPPPIPNDPQTAEYTAMIEADMARYNYAENVETFDITPNKKRG